MLAVAIVEVVGMTSHLPMEMVAALVGTLIMAAVVGDIPHPLGQVAAAVVLEDPVVQAPTLVPQLGI